MATLDIFKGDGFSAASMTKLINARPFVPGAIGRMGLFKEQGIRTTTVFLERFNGKIVLIPNTPRNAPSNQIVRDRRSLRPFIVPHLPLQDVVTADEIQDIRAYGNDSELMQVRDEVAMRMEKLTGSHDATVEFQRVGALRGLVMDATGAVLYNLYNEFGVPQVMVDFDLGNPNTDILGKCLAVREAVQDALGADADDVITVTALVGKTWFQKFITHSKVATAYNLFLQRGSDKDPLTRDLRYVGFSFGDINFRQYRGAVGGTQFMPAAEGSAFANEPTLNLFDTYYAPANFLQEVNQPGLPRYAQIVPDPFNKFVTLDTQSNPININNRPEASIKLVTTT